MARLMHTERRKEVQSPCQLSRLQLTDPKASLPRSGRVNDF
ncbi:uncharacterized protein RCC_11243 [Ramularia collo-cygni]|uniref:Uncharacterized protein n=1 Tax=Ramularia collo-cygni TaxID=112498 RepID=A0A2D3VEF7_9PEZI|nr:uncharacterized protein RCC_11243 [Ramularia collo-cygni]CZT25510.1 uncharacterized protein RCC_11243 [Ramularia collo-cygni]